MSEFHKACDKSEVSDGEKVLLEVDEQLVIMFQIGDQYFCIDDVCTHDGGTLSDGDHSGFEIECPRHGAKFDIRCGKALCMPATQPTRSHEVKVDGEEIFVKLAE